MSLRGHRATASARETSRFLVVRYGTTLLALPAGGVRGILTPQEAGMDTCVTAVGIQYEWLDLSARLSLPIDSSSQGARTVLYSYANGRCALRVEEVLGLIDVDRAHQHPMPAQFRGAERVWFHGIVLYQDTVALVLNPSWLLGGGASSGNEMPRVAAVEGRILPC